MLSAPKTVVYFDEPQAIIERIYYNIEKVMIGKRKAIEKVVIALLCGGHVLLEDVPGVGKTMLVRSLAKTIGCSYKRIQFTADLLPSDVTGVSIYNRNSGEFEFRAGPIMANLVLADEINRTSPRTQAALLEAMEEQQITVDGMSYPLPAPFLLIATQNPVEYEGTYSLPEAQLDRFLLKLKLGYPQENQEVELLGRLQEKHPIEQLRPVLLQEELIQLQQQVRTIFVDESLKHYIVSLCATTRVHADIFLGASPRASIAFMRTAQARAFVQGRRYVIPDDIKEMAASVLAHRLILKMDARMSGKLAEAIVQDIVLSTPVPVLRREPHEKLG